MHAVTLKSPKAWSKDSACIEIESIGLECFHCTEKIVENVGEDPTREHRMFFAFDEQWLVHAIQFECTELAMNGL